MAYQGMIPVGSLIIGWLATEVGPRKAVFVEGIIGLMATIIFALYKKRTDKNFHTFSIKSKLVNQV